MAQAIVCDRCNRVIDDPSKAERLDIGFMNLNASEWDICEKCVPAVRKLVRRVLLAHVDEEAERELDAISKVDPDQTAIPIPKASKATLVDHDA